MGSEKFQHLSHKTLEAFKAQVQGQMTVAQEEGSAVLAALLEMPMEEAHRCEAIDMVNAKVDDDGSIHPGQEFKQTVAYPERYPTAKDWERLLNSEATRDVGILVG